MSQKRNAEEEAVARIRQKNIERRNAEQEALAAQLALLNSPEQVAARRKANAEAAAAREANAKAAEIARAEAAAAREAEIARAEAWAKLTIEERHELTLKYLGIEYHGIRMATSTRRRSTYCWWCHNPLDNSVYIECASCNWILCRCGACGCGYRR